MHRPQARHSLAPSGLLVERVEFSEKIVVVARQLCFGVQFWL
jgi:hypothetical protein